MFLNIFFDIFLVVILVGGASYGYNKGLFKMTAGPAKIILCVTLSLSYSSLVSNYIVYPFVLREFGDSITPVLNLLINPLSTAIAFGLLFFIIKTTVSFFISLLNRGLKKGIAGRINSALGFVLASTAAFLTVVAVVSIIEYLIKREAFSGISIFSGFSGGPIYRFFILISPIGLIF